MERHSSGITAKWIDEFLRNGIALGMIEPKYIEANWNGYRIRAKLDEDTSSVEVYGYNQKGNVIGWYIELPSEIKSPILNSNKLGSSQILTPEDEQLYKQVMQTYCLPRI